MPKILILTMVLLIGAGCATTYQKANYTGGYSETRLSENVWIVYFKGNGSTSLEKTIDFSLLRSAELALENGFNFFALTDSTLDINTGAYATPTHAYTTGPAFGFRNSGVFQGNTQYYSGQTITIKKPSTSNTVIMFKEKPENARVVFSAEFVIQSIKGKYNLK